MNSPPADSCDLPHPAGKKKKQEENQSSGGKEEKDGTESAPFGNQAKKEGGKEKLMEEGS